VEITIETSTNFVTPLALVLVTLKVNVPDEGEAEVVTVSVADAELLETNGMVTLEGDRVNVTPVGAVPFQAVLNSAVSLTPLSECSVILDDLLEEAMSASDCGEADKVYEICVGRAGTRMVPTPIARVLPSVELVSLTENDRLDEFGAPPRICTVICWLVMPGANISVPEVAT